MQNYLWWLIGGVAAVLAVLTVLVWRSSRAGGRKTSLVIVVTALCVVLAGPATVVLWPRNSPPPPPTGATGPAPKSLTGLEGLVAPVGTCDSVKPVALDESGPKVFEGKGFPQVSLAIDPEHAFGDLDPDGADEIGVHVSCRPADGRVLLADEFLFFTGKSGTPEYIGKVDARHQAESDFPRVGRVERVEITVATVTSTEQTWLSSDPQCCPSAKAVSRWIVKDGVLVKQSTRVCSNARCP